MSEKRPDFAYLKNYLQGNEPMQRLPIADLLIDDPILQQYTQKVLKQTWVDRDIDPVTYFRNYCDCYIHMGFDYIPVHFWIQNTYKNFPTPKTWIAHDTGIITTREDFLQFPWEELEIDYSCLDIVTEMLPPNMKIVVVTGDLQDLMDVVVGTVAFFLMMYDDPGLLDDIITKWYSIKYQIFEKAVSYASVGAVFTCADLGSKSATLVSPDFIQEKLIPWYKKYSELVHRENRMYWFHSCGNIYTHNVINTLIDEVGIDAFHSFQDSILPATEFLRRYGHKVAVLGGLDLDKICSLSDGELRNYIQETVRIGVQYGRLAIGTGNSVASYVPFEKWLLVLQEVDKLNR